MWCETARMQGTPEWTGRGARMGQQSAAELIKIRNGWRGLRRIMEGFAARKLSHLSVRGRDEDCGCEDTWCAI